MVRVLSPELAEIAEKELNENPRRLDEDLQHLKDWISKQPHLKARTDDQWLVANLRSCKFSLERVKKKLDLYYTLRTIASDVTLRIKPTDPKFIEFLKLGTCVVLPKCEKKLMPRIILLRPGSYDPARNHVADLMCILYYLVLVLIIEDDYSTVMGVKLVIDYKGTTLQHLAQATPAQLKKIIAVSQESMPLRSRGSHHVNIPSGIEMIFTLVRGLLNEKAKERMRIHKMYDELLNEIPKEIVPAELGGSGGTIDEITDYWVKKIQEYKGWMSEEVQLGTDETKRVGPAKTAADKFGVEGSFRKLELD